MRSQEGSMDILGLGTQIHDCIRVRKLIDRHGERFLYEVFTEREIAYCNARTHVTEYFAAIWATKEAVFRALGTKWRRGVNWRNVEVVCESSIAPRVILTGTTREVQTASGVTEVKVTFGYSRLFATATAVAVR